MTDEIRRLRRESDQALSAYEYYSWMDKTASSMEESEAYQKKWLIAERKSNEAYRLLLSTEAAALTGRAQAAKWALLCSHQMERGENDNDMIVGLAVAGANVRLEASPDHQSAVVSFRLHEVYRPGDGPMYSDISIPSAVLWRSIMEEGLTYVYGWATSFDYDDPNSYYEAARVMLTFAVTGDNVVITFDSRHPAGTETTFLPLATLRAALGQDN